MTDGCISAMDVECAYLFRIGDLAVRSSAFGTLLAQLARGGILSAAVADWLSAQCCRDVVATDPRGGMRVKVHHMKYRFLGSPHLRTKTYFHLEMTDHRETESMSS